MIYDTSEPKLTQPNHVEPAITQALPGLCVVGTECLNDSQKRHVLGIVQEGNYYVRFFTQSRQMLAILGVQPDGLPPPETKEGWNTLQDSSGTRYHQTTDAAHELRTPFAAIRATVEAAQDTSSLVENAPQIHPGRWTCNGDSKARSIPPDIQEEPDWG